MGEMWSYVHDKAHQCWLWHAIDHRTGEVLAYTFGTREHYVSEELFLLLKPFSISKVYVDGNYVCEMVLGVDKVKVGKCNMPNIERKHLSLRAWVKRLACKSICF